MPGRPVGAAVLSLTGGLVVLLFGPISWAIGFCSACVEPRNAIPAAIEGFLIIAAGAGMYLDPTRHRVWGGAVIALSILSLLPLLGGFFIGMTLGIAGGALGVVWKPTGWPSTMPGPLLPATPGGTVAASAPPVGANRFCGHCGTQLPPGSTFCGRCGARA